LGDKLSVDRSTHNLILGGSKRPPRNLPARSRRDPRRWRLNHDLVIQLALR